jgi:YidC/Oxa1 family membrane protein insertase
MENNRRFILAIVLTVLVITAVNFLFPTPKPPATAAGTATPAASAVSPAPTPGAPATPVPGAPDAVASAVADSVAVPGVAAVPVETVTVAGPRAAYRISTLGGALVGARMSGYKSLAPARGGELVELARPGDALLRYRLVVPGDTLDLARTAFRAQTTPGAGGVTTVRLEGAASGRVQRNVPVTLTYAVHPDSFLVRLQGAVQGITGPSFLLVDLPPTLAVTERDTLDHYNQLAYAWKPKNESAASEAFGKLDPGERTLVEGPLTWAVTKSKYFLLGVLASPVQPFGELALAGAPRTSKIATRGAATAVLPLANGGFSFEAYVGPQEWRRLVAMGRDFENANPYGGWFAGIVQPFSTMAMRTILWLHDALKLSYGWVLIVLGVLVRLLLWPLQQNAMRSQIKMQRIQPELQLIQTKYKSDPQKLQAEMMKVYAEHGMSPFSALTGCLPMLLPMPIFFALFFVFQNTIEFRGVSFLWLADISLKDPYYVLPVLVAATSFLMSWIGMRGTPPNPQTQMITYMMPAMFLFFFISVASGLNLYYLTQNLVALPQQWLLANERKKAGVTTVVQGTPQKKPPRGGQSALERA